MNGMIGAATTLSLAGSFACSLACSSAAFASDDAELRRALAEIEALRAETDALRTENGALAAKMERLEERFASDGAWLTEQRAQEIRAIVGDVLADASSRASLASDGSTAGYEPSRGFFLKSADDAFLLRVRGELYFRFAASSRDIAPGSNTPGSSHGFEFRRTRLVLNGHVIDPTWTYDLKVGFNRNATAGNNAFLEDAFVAKDLGDGWSIRAGQFKAPFLREELVPTAQQMAVERSLVNEVFSAGRSQGLRLGWTGEDHRIEGFFGDALRANASAPVTGLGGTLGVGPAAGVASPQNTGFSAAQSDFAFAARAEWKLAGSWRQFRDMHSFRGEDPGVLLGVAGYAQQLDPTQVLGGASPDVLLAATADLSVELGGTSIFLYAVYRGVSLESPVAVRGGGLADSLEQWGAVAQVATFVAEDVELYARYEIGDTDTDRFRTAAPALGASGERLSLALVGCNWWPAGSRNRQIRLSADVGYGFAGVVDFSTTGASWLPDETPSGGQTPDGQWVVRSQLQFIF